MLVSTSPDNRMHSLILLACVASTWFMTGLIWFVQIVHYPLFGKVGRAEFAEYHAAHTRLTTRLVVGPMILELLTAAALVVLPPAGLGPALPCLGLAATFVCWLSTGWIQVPLHRRLSLGHDLVAARRLVRSNLVRTLAWSAHGLIVLGMIGRAGFIA
jgi:hypothetical protein